MTPLSPRLGSRSPSLGRLCSPPRVARGCGGGGGRRPLLGPRFFLGLSLGLAQVWVHLVFPCLSFSEQGEYPNNVAIHDWRLARTEVLCVSVFKLECL
jgi:hypothetical protein